MNQTQAARTDTQLELETLALEMGIRKYREALAAGGLTEVSAGQQLILAAVRPMEEALRAWLEETSQGVASRSAGVFYFIDQFDPVAAAWMTAHTVMALLHERPSLAKVATALALHMEGHLNLEAIEQAQPKLAAKMAKKLATLDEVKNRAVFIRKGGELADVKVIQWDEKTRLRVGTLLVALFTQSTELVAQETANIGQGKTSTIIRPTEACMKWLEVSHARCELLSPARFPLVCRPRAWTNPFNGGYLTKRLRQPIVKTRNRGYLSQLKEWDMPAVYAAVNALQETEWAVNEDIYRVVDELRRESRADGGLPVFEELPLPAKGWVEGEDPDEAELHVWKVGAARTYEARAKNESKRLQLVQKLWTAELMMEHGNRFHYAYAMDWRGRMYPVGSGLNPQGDDVAKAMLCFARTEPLGETGAYWLAVHGANSFGVDKVSFEERIRWVEENTDRILAAADHPTTGTMWWCEADSPFVFLAFCQEWARLQKWVDAGLEQERFQSKLAVAFDGTCNGLQNFSAMLLDEVGGKATGLIPADKPADIYTAVAKATQALIDQHAATPSADRVGAVKERKATKSRPAAEAREGELRQDVAKRWVGRVGRKHAKRNTMTVPYGVTLRGMRDQLYRELEDSLPEHRSYDAAYLAACNYEAIGTVVVAARLAMDWLREAAKVAASNQLPVRWETPMGLLVVQDYRLDQGEEVDFTVLGRRYCLMLNKTGDELNTRKQALGISPNFVHSLDAAHLMRTTLLCKQDGMQDFAMIHDSYGCHAGRAGLLRDNLRAAFIDQYSEPVLEKFRNELLEQLPAEKHEELPPLPPMGTLDLELVRQSEYFFA